MKSTFFTLITIICFVQCSFAQTNFSFINFDSQWNMLAGDIGGNGNTTAYRFNGDSISVNNLVYFTMEYSVEELGVEWIPYDFSAYREDDKKVYQLNLVDSSEVLLYDFGLEVGDVLLGENFIGEVDLTVVDIDSIQLEDGSLRKRIYLSNGDDCMIPWVEGLGSIYYGFNQAEYTCFADVGTTLICFSQNGIPLFFENQDFFGCWWENEPQEANLIDFRSQWNIVSGGQFSSNLSTVKIRLNTIPKSYQGKTYYHTELSNDENGSEWTLIETQAFSEVDDKVYLYNPTDSTELLIHDFSLIEGEIFISREFANDPGTELTVVLVDSIELQNGSSRKRITLNCGSNFDIIWIQGIGNIDYPLASTIYSCFFDVPGHLLCYYSDGDIVYEGVNNTEGCWVTDVEEIPESEINIYPNPTNNYLYLEAENNITQARVFNLQGQLILDHENVSRIDCSNLNFGMYFLHLTRDIQK